MIEVLYNRAEDLLRRCAMSPVVEERKETFFPDTEVVPLAELSHWVDEALRLSLSQPEKALPLGQTARKVAERDGYSIEAARARLALGFAYRNLGRLDEACHWLRDAIAQGLSLNHAQTVADGLRGMGAIHFQQGETSRAALTFSEALTLYQEIHDVSGEAQTLMDLGSIQADFGNYIESSALYAEALRLARNNPLESSLEGQILCNTASILARSGELEAALALWEEGLTLTDSKSSIIQATLRANLCRLYRRLGQLEAAEVAGKEALRHAHTSGNPTSEARARQALAELYTEREEWEKADTHYRAAQSLLEKHGLRAEEPCLLRSIGYFYRVRKKPATARRFYLRARDIARQIRLRQEEAEAEQALSAIHADTKDFRSALEHFQAYSEIERSLQREAAKSRLEINLTRLDVEKARQEAARTRARHSELLEAYRAQSELLGAVERQAQQMTEAAMRDTLTGLYNRRYVEETLARELAQANLRGVPLPLAILDLDNFKRVNDRFGHSTGDVVLRTVGHLLRQHTRTTDLPARYGGEEFLLLLSDTDINTARAVCERIRVEIACYPWQSIHPELVVTASFGLCACPGLSRDDLLAEADRRLYQAKRDGKNRIIADEVLQKSHSLEYPSVA